MSSNTSFIVIQQWMLDDLQLKANELIVYAYIYGFSQDGQSYWYGGLENLCERTGVGITAAKDILKRLVERKLICKKDVKTITTTSKDKKAYGCCHYCLYWAAITREQQNVTRTDSDLVTETDSDHATRTDSDHNNKGNTINLKKTTAATEIKDSPSLTLPSENQNSAAADFVQTKLRELFDGHYVFDSNFVPVLCKLKSDFALSDEDFSLFLKNTLQKAKDKKPVSLTNMFFRMAQNPAILQDFIIDAQKIRQEEAKKQQNLAECPVCRTSGIKKTSCCPVCAFDMNDLNDSQKVSYSRQVYQLPPERHSAFESEIQAELNRFFSYGVTEQLRNPLLKKQRDENITKIKTKYGITA